MYCLKDGRGWLIGVTLLSEIPVPYFGTLCPQQPFIQFILEVLHGEAKYIMFTPRCRMGWDISFFYFYLPFGALLLLYLSRTYFAAFWLRSFLSSSFMSDVYNLFISSGLTTYGVTKIHDGWIFSLWQCGLRATNGMDARRIFLISEFQASITG